MSHARERGVPRSLYSAMTLQFAIGGAVVPFVSILLRDRGLSFSQISHIFLVSSSTLLIFPFLWGMLADRVIPIHRLFTLLNVLITGALVIFFFQRSFLGLLLSFTFFYCCFNPSLTLINALSFHHLQDPQAQFGRLRAWGSLGWILPSLPIYLWLTGSSSPRLDFVLLLGVALAVVMVGVTFFLPHTGHVPTVVAPERPAQGGYWPAVKGLLRDPDYVTILLSFFLVSASFFLLTFYSPPYLEDAGVPRAWIGPIQSIAIVVEIVLFHRLRAVIARWNYTLCILTGCLALLLRHVLFGWADAPVVLSASYALAGVVVVFYHNTVSILVNAMAPPNVRATSQTMLVFVSSGLGPMFANWAASRLAATSSHNLRPVFLFAAVLAGLAALLVLFRGKSLNRKAHAANLLVEEPIAVVD